MTPNLFVAASTLVNPRRWFSHSHSSGESSPVRTTERWTKPVPGTYEFKSSRWYLIQRDTDDEPLEKPDRVLWSDALDRKILLSDYEARSVKAPLPKPRTPRPSLSHRRSSTPQHSQSRRGSRDDRHHSDEEDDAHARLVNFVRLDDGVTYLNDRDVYGQKTKGPWQRFCIDRETGKMRPMLKADDPARRNRPTSNKSSLDSPMTSLSAATTMSTDRPTLSTPATSVAGSSRSSSFRDLSRPGVGVKGPDCERSSSRIGPVEENEGF